MLVKHLEHSLSRDKDFINNPCYYCYYHDYCYHYHKGIDGLSPSFVPLPHQTSSPGVVLHKVSINGANNEVLHFHLVNINRSTVFYTAGFTKEVYSRLVMGNSQAIHVSF